MNFMRRLLVSQLFLGLFFGLFVGLGATSSLAQSDLSENPQNLAEGTGSELPYLDTEFQCIDVKQAQMYVADFSIDVKSFGGMELCNSQVDTKKLLNDLSIIQNGRFGTSGNSVYIRGFVDAKNYYGWMKSQTRGMDRGNDIPYATAYNRGGYFTMQDGWAQASTLGRVGVVIHEARHTAGFRHVPCNQGSYQGSSVSGCDTTYNYGGSHAIEMEYYARVSVQGENFHPVYRTMARLMAVARSNFMFNTSPIVKREGLLAISQGSEHGMLFADGTLYDREVPNFEGQLKRTSYGGVILNGLKAMSIELYERSGFQPLIEDTYSYFKLLDPETPSVFDLEEYDIGTRRFLTQINTHNQIATFNFPQGTWNQLRPVPFQTEKTTTTLENGQQGYFLIDHSGAIYSFNSQNQSLGAALEIKWDFNVLSVARLGEDLYVLKKDGRIYLRKPKAPEILWSDEQQSYSGLVAVPIYTGFDIKN
ncbi:MAG: hypothetical protein IPK04_20775 [Bdellovibrionales bacterium]|nr:hypothetical protein [Bdellovibrionales bacterium]